MSLLLWVVTLVLVLAIAGAAWWGYRYARAQPDEASAGSDDRPSPAADSDDLAGLQGGSTGAQDAGATSAESAGSGVGSDAWDDPVTAFELDPDEWAPLSQRSRRMGYARGALRGAGKPTRLAGEPDAIFEHQEGRIAVGLDAGRAYEGHPQWSEVSALTLQMGSAKMRWPKAEVTGLIRYTDCTVPVPYKPELFKDLRRAARSHKDKELPEANELATGETAAKPAPGGDAEEAPARPGLLARLRGTLARS